MRHQQSCGDETGSSTVFTVPHLSRLQIYGSAFLQPWRGEELIWSGNLIQPSCTVVFANKRLDFKTSVSEKHLVLKIKIPVCLILSVLNKDAGLLVCTSVQLVPVFTDHRPSVDIWCPLRSPSGFGLLNLTRCRWKSNQRPVFAKVKEEHAVCAPLSCLLLCKNVSSPNI